jgi:16S rRNA (cytosine1402-N4)-methyltransferase
MGVVVSHVGNKKSTNIPHTQSSPSPVLQNHKTIHLPVLLDETIEFLEPVDGGIYVDGTLGLGGHSEKILQTCAPTGRVIGFEWDAAALESAKNRLKPFDERFLAVHRNYSEIKLGLAELGITKADGLLLDLGVSSLQLDTVERGFSFQGDGPLDMRMDRRQQQTAEEIIHSCSEDELADIFYYLGEERQARRIAAAIVQERKKERIDSTGRLARIVARAVPRKYHPKRIHMATKIFQALRIAVNKELDNLSSVLDSVTDFLKPGAKICIISFHSLEDRLIKRKFRENSFLQVLTKKPIVPGKAECNSNPRARSAKLRTAMVKG